jgi:hypothetical protein
MPPHVFVSYSQPDRDCADELVSRIEAHGIGAWIAPRDISPSAEWAAEIIDAIASAWMMVLVFSSHSNDSPQVRREVERAVHKQVPILPFRIENVLPSKSLEYFLSAQHWLDAFPPPLEPHYLRLCAKLANARRADRPTAPAPHARATDTSLSVTAPGAAAPGAAAPGAAAPGSFATASLTASPPALVLEEQELRRLERALAYHVGPVARTLIRRTAARVNDRGALLQGLALEIEREEDRRRFIAEGSDLLPNKPR